MNINMRVPQVSHFINGLKCSNHDHGASCAVDALLELFYYGIYKHDAFLQQSDSTDGLCSKLISTCIAREAYGADCSIREQIWMDLVNVLPHAYYPQGRRDAEILAALQTVALTPGPSFQTEHAGELHCCNPICSNTQNFFFTSSALHYLDATLNNRCNGNIARVIEESLHQSVMQELMFRRCDACLDQFYLGNFQSQTSRFFMVALGLSSDARNLQLPQVVVPEVITVRGCLYHLRGAIQMEPGHFLAICKVGDQFGVFDGCLPNMAMFSTFAAAVSRSSDSQREKVLSGDDKGIHILLYGIESALDAPSPTVSMASVSGRSSPDLNVASMPDVSRSSPCPGSLTHYGDSDVPMASVSGRSSPDLDVASMPDVSRSSPCPGSLTHCGDSDVPMASVSGRSSPDLDVASMPDVSRSSPCPGSLTHYGDSDVPMASVSGRSSPDLDVASMPDVSRSSPCPGSLAHCGDSDVSMASISGRSSPDLDVASMPDVSRSSPCPGSLAHCGDSDVPMASVSGRSSPDLDVASMPDVSRSSPCPGSLAHCGDSDVSMASISGRSSPDLDVASMPDVSRSSPCPGSLAHCGDSDVSMTSSPSSPESVPPASPRSMADKFTTFVVDNLESQKFTGDSSITLHYVIWHDKRYVRHSDVISYLNLEAHMNNRGYRSFCNGLTRTNNECSDVYLLEKGSKCRWIQVEILISLLCDKKFFRQKKVEKHALKNALMQTEPACSQMHPVTDCDSSKPGKKLPNSSKSKSRSSAAASFTTTIHCGVEERSFPVGSSETVRYTTWQGDIYLATADVFSCLQLTQHISSQGYKFICSALRRNKQDNNSVFLEDENKAKWIQMQALIILLKDAKFFSQNFQHKNALYSHLQVLSDAGDSCNRSDNALPSATPITPNNSKVTADTDTSNGHESKVSSGIANLTTALSEEPKSLFVLRVQGTAVSYLEWPGQMYFSLSDCFKAIDKPSYLSNRGFGEIGSCLTRLNICSEETFLHVVLPTSTLRDTRWIAKKALQAMLRDHTLFPRKKREKLFFLTKLQNMRSVSMDMEISEIPSDDCVDMSPLVSPGSVPPDNESSDTSSNDFQTEAQATESSPILHVPVSGSVRLHGQPTSYVVHKDKVFIEIRAFALFTRHIGHRGYGHLQQALTAEGLDPSLCCVTCSGQYKWTHMTSKALLLLVHNFFVCNSVERQMIVDSVDELKDIIIVHLLNKDPQNRPMSNTFISKRNSEKLTDFVAKEIGSKEAFLETISQLIASPQKIVTGLNSMYLDKDDLMQIFLSAAKCPSKRGLVRDAVTQYFSQQHPFSAEEMLFIQENFSGVRLIDAMRKKIPGLIPSVCQERTARISSRKAFRAVLLPKQTATGWRVDPMRLLEAILHKYHFVTDDVLIRLWGDGREIGGRHNVLIGMSIVNNSLKLRDESYHDPKGVFPLLICHEGDSRDNLEENLGKSQFLENFVKTLPSNVRVFLCGDHMFLQNILGSEADELSPTSDLGWNLYSKTSKEQKKQVAKNGLRTDLTNKFDRPFPNSLLPSIPVEQTVFCTLHAVARIVEKLLNLEINIIFS